MGVLSFAQQHEREEKGWGSTWWVPVAGEETNESLGTWDGAPRKIQAVPVSSF